MSQTTNGRTFQQIFLSLTIKKPPLNQRKANFVCQEFEQPCIITI